MSRSKYEKKAQAELEKEGWEVDWKVRPFRVSKGYQVDFLARFDLLCYRRGTLRLIAIKGHQGVPKELRDKIKDFNVDKIVKEIWVFRKNKTIKKETI